MSVVVAEAAVSLDGFVAFPDDAVGPLFDWYSGRTPTRPSPSSPTDWAARSSRPRTFAGDREVSLTAGDLTGQALAAGLVDEVEMALVPVVFGQGVRFFGEFAEGPVLLEDPHVVVHGDRVVHLRYSVRKG